MNRNPEDPAHSRQAVDGAYDRRLPIFARHDEIITALRTNQVVVIAGETGSGKTTQLPLMCLEAGFARHGAIGCTQPRRIAATSIAHHVARLVKSPIGSLVGYKIRFDERLTPRTAVKFMTDGILLAEIENDPLLKRYGAIIVDEAHERSVNIDFILGYLRKILPRRPDLKVVVSSATIDTRLFSKSFGNAPIIEVSGRLFPVEILYEPPGEEGDLSYVEAGVKSVGNILDLSDDGDVLVFMPTERDIRETIALLQGTFARRCEVLPLFSRLSSAEQNRIFHASALRKVIVATNIAETSITIPGIRFVVDIGLARTVRYAPHLRTTSMPVEPVSRASANQRSGRCGRVAEGICFRLYAKNEFATRPEFTEPEISRVNLAGVLLQMMSLRLGPIETFPFLEMPQHRAISDGYTQLVELGALDAERRLTDLGREMARLPLDPHIARMVLQARNEGALREVKIIASGLSTVDPRERPLEKQAQADEAHRRFLDPQSDFLTYLKLWNAYMGAWEEQGSQTAMRRYCHEHFLSFNRMREWHDVHQQLSELCTSRNGFRDNRQPAAYDAIHRSLLSGLLMNVVMRHPENGLRATRGREVHIFPGSALHKKPPPWIMCHQIVETSRVFCRTAAMIDPLWIEQLAPDLCRRSYTEPSFDDESGAVQAKEQVLFFGLPIVRNRPVFYGRIDPARAAEIFVLDGLVDGRLKTHLGFLTHNRGVRARIETIEARLRTRRLYAGDEAVAAFYRERLPGVASIHDLNRVIKERGGESFLKMQLDDLLAEGVPADVSRFPDELSIGGERFPITYRFVPGADDDGVTVTIPGSVLAVLGEHSLEWVVPGLRIDQVASILSAVPKVHRSRLVPIAEHAERIARRLRPSEDSLGEAIGRAMHELYGVVIDAAALSLDNCDLHLRPRIEVTDGGGTVAASYRLPGHPGSPVVSRASTELPLWMRARREWEKAGQTTWTFGDIPGKIPLDDGRGDVPLYACPVLAAGDDHVDLRLLPSSRTVRSVHSRGVVKLLELVLADDFGWLEKELTISKEAGMRCAAFATRPRIQAALFNSVKNQVFRRDLSDVRSKAAFDAEAGEIRTELSRIRTAVAPLFDRCILLLSESLSQIDLSARAHPTRHASLLKTELKAEGGSFIAALFQPGFTYARLEEYPRYLTAFKKRVQVAFDDPVRYRQGMATIGGLIDKADKLKGRPDHAEIRDMIEELQISLFAQQSVKTKYPVSEKRILERLASFNVDFG